MNNLKPNIAFISPSHNEQGVCHTMALPTLIKSYSLWLSNNSKNAPNFLYKFYSFGLNDFLSEKFNKNSISFAIVGLKHYETNLVGAHLYSSRAFPSYQKHGKR
jgi:hypothetical protein